MDAKEEPRIKGEDPRMAIFDKAAMRSATIRGSAGRVLLPAFDPYMIRGRAAFDSYMIRGSADNMELAAADEQRRG